MVVECEIDPDVTAGTADDAAADEPDAQGELGETWPSGVPAELDEDSAQAYLVHARVDWVLRRSRLTARQIEGVALLTLGLSDLEIEHVLGVGHAAWREHWQKIRDRVPMQREELQAVVRPRASARLRQVLAPWLRNDVLSRVLALLGGDRPPQTT